MIDDFRGESPDIAALRARSLLAKDSSDMDDYRDVCPPTERYTEDDADLALELAQNVEAYHRILSASASLSSLR